MKIQLNTHVERRKAEYPPLAEQLDMLWHSMDRGELPKAEPWYSEIQRIKAAHAKTQ